MLDIIKLHLIHVLGFTPDAKVWRLKFGASESFEGVKRAYDLTGHKASIYSCSMNADCTRMVTVSKDGTWKLFDTDSKYTAYKKAVKNYFTHISLFCGTIYMQNI